MDLTQSIEPRIRPGERRRSDRRPHHLHHPRGHRGKAESPFDFMLVETDRAYRPSKTMRRVIVNAWGAEAANYAGRRLTLYREPTIKFGGKRWVASASRTCPTSTGRWRFWPRSLGQAREVPCRPPPRCTCP